jgi:hypothetical protein
MSIEDIKEAIEVLEDASAEMLMETGDKDYYREAIAILRQAIEQTEKQEPVVYVDNRIHGWPECFVMEPDPPHTSPLYTAPVDGVTISEERVDEIVKQEHDKQIEIAQAYERGWNAALAQQEPVACIGTTGELMWLNKPKVIYSKPIPLYTAPVDGVTISEERVDETTDLAIVGEVGVWGEREWVGLTDEEVSEVIDNVLEGGGWLDVARAIEAAIKEKNT